MNIFFKNILTSTCFWPIVRIAAEIVQQQGWCRPDATACTPMSNEPVKNALLTTTAGRYNSGRKREAAAKVWDHLNVSLHE